MEKEVEINCIFMSYKLQAVDLFVVEAVGFHPMAWLAGIQAQAK